MVLTSPTGIPHLPWLFSFSLFLATASPVLANNPDVIKVSHHDVSLPLSRMVIGTASNAGGSRVTEAALTGIRQNPASMTLSKLAYEDEEFFLNQRSSVRLRMLT